MTRIILCGCCGKMGHFITQLVSERTDCEIVAGVDLNVNAQTASYPAYTSIDQVAVRGGTIVGEHEVIFAGNNEVITLSHSAQSKELFAVGAVNAAVFMSGKGPGLYDMSALV